MTQIITSEEISAPGLYRMSEASYHADTAPQPSLSRSIGQKLILESPRHAFTAHPRLTKQEDEEDKNSRARDVGSAAHALLLGQPTEIVVIEYADFKKKVAQDLRADAQERGAIPLLEKDAEKVEKMIFMARNRLIENEHASVRAIVDPDATSVFHNEITGAWVDPCGQRWARFRADRLHEAPTMLSILDYKTTEMSAAPDNVAKAIYTNNYHFQDAFYRRGARLLFPEIDRHEKKLEFLFIVQEQEPPFEITVAKVDPAGRLIGEKMVSAAFMLWRKCWAENNWPGYPRETKTAECPAYVDTRWTSKEIEDPYLQGLGIDPVMPFEQNPYRSPKIMEPN
jgi:hypothetical protein